ncbi:Alkylated dna repair protein alkb-like 5 protein [Dioscorea alata]|uniref:Alkylated dna repair protein alkb-like 5 protein n=2 Tax=Dioscorea alata TaxID=55571 RepID=A0ACB7WBV1_DIOAL|nr:Alkylated dna repair protein alkb-like 5 protein [Dioscorea alata]
MDEFTAKFDRISVRNREQGNVEDDNLKDQEDFVRMSLVKRKKDFRYMERIEGRLVNIAEGLELHTGVFDAVEQKKIVDFVYRLQAKGRAGILGERTYSEPRKWMRGKGRVTIQFGCCYNYATDKDGNLPGIVRSVEADPMAPLLISMIKRMVAWRVLPSTCVPNSCIINLYDKDDCIPPHIDHHDFLRPFCTVSLLSECNILFGTNMKVLGPGEFSGSLAIPLPLGSVLILKGNGADIAKHCVPAVPAKRISITFRKMDDRKLPYRYTPDPELRNLRPLASPSVKPSAQPAHSSPQAVNPHSQNLMPDVRLTTTPASQSRKAEFQAQKPETANQGVKDSMSSNPFRANDFPSLSSTSSKPSKRSWK